MYMGKQQIFFLKKDNINKQKNRANLQYKQKMKIIPLLDFRATK